MVISIRLFLVAIVTVAIGVPALAQGKQELAGSYLFRFEWGGTRITLNLNGTFVSQSSNCTMVTTESGPYSVSGDILHLTTVKETLRNYDEKKEHDLRNR